MIVCLGIDVVDLEEFRDGLTDSLKGKLYLPGEIDYARTQARPWESLGARLAAKRAVSMALNAGAAVEPVWHEIETVRGESGELDVRLSGRALALAQREGASVCHLSMSHTKRTAMAVAILEDGEH